MDEEVPGTAPAYGAVRYLIRYGHCKEIATHRSNEFILLAE